MYQVTMTNKKSSKVYHVGLFRLHAYAVNCMIEISAAHVDGDCVVNIWQHNVFEGCWDGNMNYRGELTQWLPE